MAPDAQESVSFHVHAWHAFEGLELVEDPDAGHLLLARCECGIVLDVADARFVACPECGGRDRPSRCARCAGAGRVIDHAALQWRTAAQDR